MLLQAAALSAPSSKPAVIPIIRTSTNFECSTIKIVEMGMKEQRRARRFALDIKIQEIIGKSAKGARLLNLSSNGARVELPFSAKIFDQVAFWVLLPGFKKPTKFIGRVAWKKPGDAEGRYVTGLQFYQHYWEIDQWLRQQPLKAKMSPPRQPD